jgi:hypothetical protein
MKMPLRAAAFCLLDDEDAGGDAGALKEIGGEADDGFGIAGADELPADDRFGVAAEEDAVGKNAGGFAGAFGGADDVEEVGVITVCGVARPRRSAGKGRFPG